MQLVEGLLGVRRFVSVSVAAIWAFSYFLVFFMHKTVYELRISDWSSDVCSSDLRRCLDQPGEHRLLRDRQIFGITAEIMMRRGVEPVDIVAEIDVRKVARQDLVLGDRKSTRLNYSH